MATPETIDLAEYLFVRLQQLGLDTIHGVPGDYNLSALDYIEPLGLQWAGNSNELNAGYAADGYARVKGIGALITTSGVGELSAINAIAGAYAERSPVVHITGTPAVSVQESGLCLHHTFGDGNFRRFAQMAEHVVVAHANLNTSQTAADDVDRVLALCKLHSRPVYLELPTDMVKAKVPRGRLETAIDPAAAGVFDAAAVESTADQILQRLYASRQPLLLIDGFANRFDTRAEIEDLAQTLGIPTCTTAFGKTVLRTPLPNFYGVYSGPTGDANLHAWVQDCDLILALGPLFSDSNTFGFTTKPGQAVIIAVQREHVELPNQTVQGLPMKRLLQALLAKLEPTQLSSVQHPTMEKQKQTFDLQLGHEPLRQRELWNFLSQYLSPGDIVLADTGTSSIGSSTMRLPPQSTYITSPIWLSIGFALPATAGAAAARRDLAKAGQASHGRTIVFEGDGSFQMTAQSVSDMIRAQLNAIIIVLNNNGYTVERWIHGMKARYNDIMPWRYLQTADYFGAVQAEGYPILTQRASSWTELSRVLRHPQVVKGQGLVIVELMLDEADAPETLQQMAAVAAKRFCA
ncbi:pyruvate decarboxylase [Aspergillus heterothallicus]